MNVSSVAAYMPGPLMAAYFASKAYVLSFSEALANELADAGVSVTTLCPGPTRTGFEKRAGLSDSKAFRGRIMDAAAVAHAAYDAVMAGKSVVVPGWKTRLQLMPALLMPRSVLAHFARQYNDAAPKASALPASR